MAIEKRPLNRGWQYRSASPRSFGRGFIALALLGLFLAVPVKESSALSLSNVIQTGAAFAVHLGVHESGHYLMAHMGGAEDVDLSFFIMKGNNFYLGLSSAKGLDRKSVAPYKFAGEVAVSYHFEIMLKSYRRNPNMYNRAMLFFTNTDFLAYSIYAFYLSPTRNNAYDPVGISQETGLTPETIVAFSALQTLLNTYRIYSGNDTAVPFLSMSQDSVALGLMFRF